MNPLFYALAASVAIAQLALPFRFGFAPLLIAAFHFQNAAIVDFGASLPLTRIVILLGLARAICAREVSWSPKHSPDLLIAIWSLWLLLSGFGHDPKPNYNPITIHASLLYDYLGSYIYFRSYIKTSDDFKRLVVVTSTLMLPLAAFVIYESITLKNLYGVISGGMQDVQIRHGRARAAGPFSHPILLGTIAAASVPCFVSILHTHKTHALLGIFFAVTIVFASASSGPILTLLAACGALALWRFRSYTKSIRWSAALIILTLHLVMEDPVWYLIARIDLAGGSTGFHRAQLITEALNHLDRWWFVGTDYTRDWIPYGIEWNADMVDITNLYLKLGVTAGLSGMIGFVLILGKTFRKIGKLIEFEKSTQEAFLYWCIGSALFSHCVTFVSVNYFDQSYMFPFLLIGVTSSIGSKIERTHARTAPRVSYWESRLSTSAGTDRFSLQ